jgi:Na+-translocating ferredoxin:NAD+ oxidoreductase RnfG subunit
MKLRILIIVFFSVIGICLHAQTNIDFSPKMLTADLFQLNKTTPSFNTLKVEPEMEREISGKFYIIGNSSPTSICKYVYVGRVNTCRAGGCSIRQDTAPDKESEFFDYFILFDSKASIQLVRVYNYQATHGHEVTSKNWLKQFKGYNGTKDLVVNKNVDAISGATISVHAIAIDIHHKTGFLKEIIK